MAEIPGVPKRLVRRSNEFLEARTAHVPRTAILDTDTALLTDAAGQQGVTLRQVLARQSRAGFSVQDVERELRERFVSPFSSLAWVAFDLLSSVHSDGSKESLELKEKRAMQEAELRRSLQNKIGELETLRLEIGNLAYLLPSFDDLVSEKHKALIRFDSAIASFKRCAELIELRPPNPNMAPAENVTAAFSLAFRAIVHRVFPDCPVGSVQEIVSRALSISPPSVVARESELRTALRVREAPNTKAIFQEYEVDFPELAELTK